MDQNAEKHYLLTAKAAKTLDPSRYIVPPPAALKLLRAGHVVKLMVKPRCRVAPETVWVTITHRHVNSFIGMANKPIIRTKYHGIGVGSPVSFKLAHIIDIAFQGPEVRKEFKLI